MKIAVLGAGGFIGSHLVEHLLATTNYDLLGMDREQDKLEGISDARFRFYAGDIREDTHLLDRLVSRADVVVDLVAYANPSIYVSAPLDVIDVNFLGNLDIVDRCVEHGTRLIQYSSAEVYGKFATPEGLISEDSEELVYGAIDKSRWIYACAKQLLERIIHAHGSAGDLEYTLIRPFNFIGSRFDYLVPPRAMGGPRVFAHFMSALLSGGPIYLVDGGEQNRAFCHIADACEAFSAILHQPDLARNEIFNVGNPGNDTTIRDLAELMAAVYIELTGERPASEVVSVSGEQFYGPGYEDGYRWAPDVRKMGRLGWTPTHDLRSTLRSAMAYYLTGPRSALADVG
jgi:UDP-apiose/xylose synthase